MKPKNPFSGMRGILPIFLCFSASAFSQATWNGTTNSAWATTTNWSDGLLPVDGGNVIIANTTGGANTLNLDISRTIGALTFGSADPWRTTAFTLNTGAANNLTLNGDLTAAGNFTTTALTMRGHYTIGAAQTWEVSGSAANNTDQGVVVREIALGAANRGSLTLDADLTKTGTGQIMLTAIDLTGPGNLIISSGGLKLNAGANQPLVIGGDGNLTMQGSSVLSIYRNSGPLVLSRAIQMNGTSALEVRANAISIAAPIAFNGTHTLDSSTTATFTGAITGSGTINRSGGGAVRLAGSTAGFNGVLNLNAGTTTLGSSFGGSVNVAAGATFGGKVPVSGATTFNGGSLVINPSTPGSLHASGGLTLTGLNTIAFAGAPVSDAPFTVLTYFGSFSGDATNLTLAGGMASYRNASISTAIGGIITATVDIDQKIWTGAAGSNWDINVSDNWSGAKDERYFQMDSVTFGETGAGSVAITGILTPGSITIEGSSDYTFTAAAGNYIAGPTSLTKNGSGTTILGGVNTFTGGVIINDGILKPQNNQALGANGQLITVNSGGTLDFNGTNNAARDYEAVISGTGFNGIGAITNTSGAHGNGLRSLTLAADASIGGVGRIDIRPIAFGTGVLDLDGHTLTKTGTGIFAVVDSNATSAGSINVNAGVLGLTRSNVTGEGSINVNAGGQVYLENNSQPVTISKAIALDGGTNELTTATFRISGSALAIDSAVTVTNKATFSIEQNLTLNTGLAGSGIILKTGGSSLILRGDNTFTGEIQASAGTITFDPTAAGNFSGTISGVGGVIKQGSGTTTLNAALSNTGATTINGGSLQLGVANAISTNSTITFANTAGANVDLAGLNQEFRTITGGGGTGGDIINTGGETSVLTLRPTGGDGNTYSGAIQGDIRLEVKGTKTEPLFTTPRQRLGGLANTFTGGILIDGATLMVSSDATLGAVPASFQADNIILRNNGTLLNQADNIVLSIHENRGIKLESGGGGLVAGFNQDVTVNGVISGGADDRLSILPNNRTVILTAENTYAGETALTAATSRLSIGNGGLTGSLGAGNVVNSGVLTFNRSNDSSYAGDISGAGTVTKAGGGTLTLGGSNTYTGATTVSAGTLLVNGSLGTTNVSVANNATLGGDGTLAGTVTTVAAGSVISSGNSPGTLTVGALNVTAGATFEFELGSLSDLLVVTGALTAGTGNLTFNFSDAAGFQPGTTYTLITFGSQTGLASERLAAGQLPQGQVLDTSFGTDGWSISDNNLQVRFIPEPSTALLAGLGLLAALRRRRQS